MTIKTYLSSGYPKRRAVRHLRPARREIAGMKVRYVLRVVSGDCAKDIDARQVKAIMDVLQWSRDRREQ